jgi:hypothetical protein
MKYLFFFLASITTAAVAQTPSSAVLTWVAPSNAASLTPPITYNVYQTAQGATSGGTQIASSVTALTYTASGFTAGSTVCFNVTAVAAGVESAYSNQACKTFPVVPNAPVLTVK